MTPPAPPCRLAIDFTARRQHKNTPYTLISNMRLVRSTSNVSMRPTPVKMPALLTSACTGPSSRSTELNKLSTCAGSETSALMARQRRPSPAISEMNSVGVLPRSREIDGHIPTTFRGPSRDVGAETAATTRNEESAHLTFSWCLDADDTSQSSAFATNGRAKVDYRQLAPCSATGQGLRRETTFSVHAASCMVFSLRHSAV